MSHSGGSGDLPVKEIMVDSMSLALSMASGYTAVCSGLHRQTLKDLF